MLKFFKNSETDEKDEARQLFEKVAGSRNDSRELRSARIRMGLLLRAHIDKTFVAAIADFGISRVVTQESLAVQAFKVSDLRGASVSYAAPDVFFRFRSARDERNPNIWKAADVYALSITLLEMLKRKSPWL